MTKMGKSSGNSSTSPHLTGYRQEFSWMRTNLPNKLRWNWPLRNWQSWSMTGTANTKSTGNLSLQVWSLGGADSSELTSPREVKSPDCRGKRTWWINTKSTRKGSLRPSNKSTPRVYRNGERGFNTSFAFGQWSSRALLHHKARQRKRKIDYLLKQCRNLHVVALQETHGDEFALMTQASELNKQFIVIPSFCNQSRAGGVITLYNRRFLKEEEITKIETHVPGRIITTRRYKFEAS